MRIFFTLLDMSDLCLLLSNQNKQKTMSSSVPAFLTKLWTLVENPMVDDLICWDETGNSFHVFDQGRFAKEILPHYFKHSNIASFIRQLNMYGFRKVARIEHGIKDESDDLEFQHAYFKRGQEQLLEKIKRKIAGNTPHIKQETVQEMPIQSLNKVITEVQVMKEKQETVNAKLQSMKRENELLWREVASLRQKHSKQQQIVNKLIQFLIHLVGGRSGIGMNMNRKRPLMISDSLPAPPKMKKYGKTDCSMYSVQSPENLPMGDEGPVISELPDQDINSLNNAENNPFNGFAKNPTGLTDSQISIDPVPNKLDLSTNDWKLPPDLLSGNILDQMHDLKDLQVPSDLNTPTSPSTLPPFLEDPSLDVNHLSLFPQNSSASNTNQDRISTSLQQKTKNTPTFTRQQSLHDLNDHVDTLQYDLDGLRDVLSSNQYSIDPSFLLGLFKTESLSQSGDDVINIMDPDHIDKTEQQQNEEFTQNPSGSQLVQYKPLEVLPDLFDLANLTKEDEDTLTNTVDISDLKTEYGLNSNVPADDLD